VGQAEGSARVRSDVDRNVDVPTPPFWADRVVKGIALAEVAAYLDDRRPSWGSGD